VGTTTAAATQKQKSSFFINRNFALLWEGQAISNLGDVVFDTTLLLWIATIIARNQPWAPLASSGVLIVAYIPTLVFGPIAGVFVDRWDKRRTMLFMDVFRALLILLLLLATGLIPLPFPGIGKPSIFWQLGAIYTITFLTTICAQFFNPARFAIIGDVVDEPHRPQASGLGQVTSNIALLIGPPLAAPLLFVIGVQWALTINAISFVVSFLSILAVRVPPRVEPEASKPKTTFFQELREGLSFFGKNHTLVTILIATSIVTFGVGALNALDVYFVTQNLHTSATLYGIIGMVFGLGSILGAILSTIFMKQVGVVRTFCLGLLVSGVLILILSRQSNFILALVCFLFVGLPVVAANTAIGPMLLHLVPRNLVGRVISIFTPTMSLVQMLSVALAGYLAGDLLQGLHGSFLGMTFGTIDIIFLCTGLLVFLGGLYAMVNLRSFRMEAQKEEAATPTTTVAEVAAEA